MNSVRSNNISLKYKGLHHKNAYIWGLENLNLWQKLKSFKGRQGGGKQARGGANRLHSKKIALNLILN